MGKKYISGVSVLDAARARIAQIFDDFPRVYLSFSGGKDSSVMLHLCADEARRRGRKFGLLIVDLEAQYKLTIDHIGEMVSEYADCTELFWVALPISLRNAVSQYQPQWLCWDPAARSIWVRQPDPRSITDEAFFQFFERGMEFEDFVPRFGEWYSQGKLCACLVGIRADESLNRYRTIVRRKDMLSGIHWTTRVVERVYNCYPIYDWKTADIWRYNAKAGAKYNHLYDLMHQAGLTIAQQRICQPYGDDQRKGLWLYHVIEPETWARVVARVSGANSGAEFVQLSGNASGQRKISKPDNMTWREFAEMVLSSLPNNTREHFENKIAVFLHWYADRGYPDGIPDSGSATDKNTPSWTRICKMLLRNDYWAKGLSFTQHKSGAYENYMKLMKTRRQQWKII